MEGGTDVLNDVLLNLNTWLVMFLTGVVIWVIRQVIPVAVEDHKAWKISLTVMPVFLGALIAIIPGLMPVPDNMVQSCAIGIIGGSFATKVYELLREVVSEKMREKLGGRAQRLRNSQAPGPVEE